MYTRDTRVTRDTKLTTRRCTNEFFDVCISKISPEETDW